LDFTVAEYRPIITGYELIIFAMNVKNNKHGYEMSYYGLKMKRWWWIYLF